MPREQAAHSFRNISPVVSNGRPTADLLDGTSHSRQMRRFILLCVGSQVKLETDNCQTGTETSVIHGLRAHKTQISMQHLFLLPFFIFYIHKRAISLKDCSEICVHPGLWALLLGWETPSQPTGVEYCSGEPQTGALIFLFSLMAASVCEGWYVTDNLTHHHQRLIWLDHSLSLVRAEGSSGWSSDYIKTSQEGSPLINMVQGSFLELF